MIKVLPKDDQCSRDVMAIGTIKEHHEKDGNDIYALDDGTIIEINFNRAFVTVSKKGEPGVGYTCENCPNPNKPVAYPHVGQRDGMSWITYYLVGTYGHFRLNIIESKTNTPEEHAVAILQKI